MKPRFVAYIAAVTVACLALPLSAQASIEVPVTEAELRADIAELASDAYGGRFPGTEGQTRTLTYLTDQLRRTGFVGAADDAGGWYQPVPLVDLRYGTSAARFTDARGRGLRGVDVIARTPGGGDANIDALPLVFVGHGVDGDGQVIADVQGKIAVLLSADREDEDAMSAIDRRAALVAAGAVATLTIGAEGLRFSSLSRAYTGVRMQRPVQVSKARIEGLIDYRSARRLMRGAGYSLATLSADARASDYRGVDLPVRGTLSATTARHDLTSYNVVARLPGRAPDGKTVLMLGHWDHLGLCRPEGAPDRICNGAVDNASGLAVMLAVARRLAAGQRPDRDVVILATTAEEQGLQGAYQFAAAPPFPLSDIAVALNVDTVAVAPRGAPAAIIGRGNADIDDQIESVISQLSREVDEDREADSFLRRQDGYALAKSGVPAFMIGGSFSDMAALRRFLAGPYHGPADALTDATPLGGAADDADLHIALIRHFARRGGEGDAASAP